MNLQTVSRSRLDRDSSQIREEKLSGEGVSMRSAMISRELRRRNHPFNFWWNDSKVRGDRFITTVEAADCAGRSPSTMRRWFICGKVPGAKVENRIWILRTGLEEYLNGYIR